MHRILLTGGGSPASQNFLQSLRDAPESFYVVGVDANRYHLEWGEYDRVYESPLTNDAAYLPFLQRIIRDEKIEFIHGQPDWEVAWLGQHRDELGTKTFLPPNDVIETCQDKFLSGMRWFLTDVRRDKPMMLPRPEDVPDFPEWPMWIRATRGAGSRGSCKARSRRQARAWIEYFRSAGSDWNFVAQEFLPGRDFAFHSLWHDGQIVTSAIRERLEYVFPHLAPSGVTSSPTVARSVHNDQVNDMSTRAILAIDNKPDGIYCVDLVEDSEGIPRPTEINIGRYFTTSFFFTRLGANMPWYYVRLGLGEQLEFEPKRYDAVPADYYWIRHIDCGSQLQREGNFRAVPLKAPTEAAP